MKVLYAIQGTGNGHISRARDIIPELKKHCQLDILISGNQSDVSLNHPVKHKLRGLSFIFGKSGGVDLLHTLKNSNLLKFYTEIKTFPVEKYDLIVNDFEPITAWSAYFKGIPVVSLSHQAAVLFPEAPKPGKTDYKGHFILKNYAPGNKKLGFHFESYNENTFTPVIRNQIRELKTYENCHHTVYLPSYSDQKLFEFFKQFKDTNWHIFSKHNKKPVRQENIEIHPVNNEHFLRSITSCSGIVCGAGFETPAEALYLGKKLMVIPMKNQYEQQCNAEALNRLGVPVLSSLKQKFSTEVNDWVNNGKKLEIHYQDHTSKIIEKIFQSNGV